MFFCLPVSVEDQRRRESVPIANGVLITINVLLFWFSQVMYVGPGTGFFSIATYAFAHAGIVHLLGNMWVLWVFGNPVNRRIGNGYYLLAYLGTVVVVGLLARLFFGQAVLGSSGAIFAVMAICLLLIPSALVEVFYIAIFPLTVLVGLVSKPEHWVFWFIRWDRFKIRALWGLLIVPALELWGLFWWGWNWTNIGHLLGLVCGVAFVLLLPVKISMNRRPAFTT